MLALLAPAAVAGGYFYSDSGVVATGRGGAFVAGADDAFAQYYNPAGLIRLEHPTVHLGWSLVQQEVSFRRMKPDGTFYPPVENEASPFDVPEAAFATPLGDRVALAVGFYSPFAPSSLYPEEGPQRYTIKDTLIYQFVVGPSAAVRVHEMLTLGLGLQWTYLQVGETVDVTISGVDDPSGDIAVEARVHDPFTPNVNGGLLFDPHEAVTVGLGVQPPTSFSARGPFTLDFTDNGIESLLERNRYRDDDIALDLGIPWVLRGGVAVRPLPERERLEVEAAVVWQDWSSLADIVIRDIDVTVDLNAAGEALVGGDQPVDERLELPAGLRDTVSLRLGAESRVHELLEVRAGGFWENAALAEDEVNVALVDTPKVQLGSGLSLHLLDDRLKLDAAFAWLFFRSHEIRESTVTQIDAGVETPFPSTGPLVVGNGDLSSHGWVLGVAAAWSFFDPRKAADRG